MTYADIYKKFLIEYDKDAATTSYPSLTTTEIVNTLNKAYLALIAQKLTGTNNRGVAFEGDVKAIEDIQPLLTSAEFNASTSSNTAKNERVFAYGENNVLYYIQSDIETIDSTGTTRYPTALISHADANTFKQTAHNTPWIEYPKVFLENRQVHVLFGPDDFDDSKMNSSRLFVTYIKKPVLFTDENIAGISAPTYELSDNMAEEMINLAIIMALETVESSRLSTKVSTSKLES